MKWLALFALGAALHAAPAAATDSAIVVQDAVPLRAAARGSAPLQALLWQGDVLEVRGRHLDYWQVYDHRIERAGFVRAAQVRLLPTRPEDAPELLAVVRFLRETPGAEALGIGYLAAYLKAAPANAIGAEAFDALGTMADRLARRASSNRNRAKDAQIAAHLEVVANYGVAIRSVERDERMRLCYDGDAFRRVLALPSSDGQKARAALALTRGGCIDPDLTPLARANLDAWRADVLERAPRADLPEYVKNRLRIRSAQVWSAVAFERSRAGAAAQDAAERAMSELIAVDQRELADGDATQYDDAAARVGASRWAAEPARSVATKGLTVVTTPGEPGQTCIKLVNTKSNPSTALVERCTYGTVWANSARANAYDTALALAVQPLAAWRELWLFRLGSDGWRIDVAPPSDDAGAAGYIEFAGWVPGGRRLLAVREVETSGAFKRSFDVLDMETLAVLKHASHPEALSLFYRWQDAAWKRQTVSLR